MKMKSALSSFRSRIAMLFAASMLLGAMAFVTPPDISITIQVSPSTLNLINQGEWVTVHTDIAYGDVESASVMLNEVKISWSKADNQGNFVAKFVIGDVKNLFKPFGGTYDLGLTKLTLSGYTDDGEYFSGTSTIRVINVTPSGK